MWVYLLLLAVVFTLLIAFVISVVRISHKLIKKYIKNKVLAWILSFLPLLFFIIGGMIDVTNAIVVDLHLVVIVFFTKFIFFIIQKLSKKNINEYISLGTGVLLTFVVMCVAYYNVYNVVETDYEVFTSKDIGLDNFRIIQVSDSHLGTTMDGKKFTEYMEKINDLNPDIVVITGDFIDDNTSFEDLEEGAKGLGKLKTKYGVYFVYGNHDKGYYNKKDNELVAQLKNNNIIILEDEVKFITENIILVGRKDAGESLRKSPQELISNLDNSKFFIVLNHQPNDYDNEMNAGVDLVLSGHTHGGQLVPLGPLGVLLGANDKVYGMEKRDKTTFIVNSGISDWAMKFKTGCISEYTVIDIKK